MIERTVASADDDLIFYGKVSKETLKISDLRDVLVGHLLAAQESLKVIHFVLAGSVSGEHVKQYVS